MVIDQEDNAKILRKREKHWINKLKTKDHGVVHSTLYALFRKPLETIPCQTLTPYLCFQSPFHGMRISYDHKYLPQACLSFL